VRARFEKKTHELNVTTISMAILMLFNTTDTLTYKEMLAILEVNEVELKKNLQSLACGKYKILLKNPKGREVRTSLFFSFCLVDFFFFFSTCMYHFFLDLVFHRLRRTMC